MASFPNSNQGEDKLVFSRSKIIWQVTFDLGSSIEDIKPAAKNLYDSPICRGLLSYLPPERRDEGVGEIQIKGIQEGGESQEIKDDTYEHLEAFQKSDFLYLDEEYFESGQYARLRLQGIKILVLGFENYADVDVYVTLNRYGVAVLSFWMDIEEPVTSRKLAELQIIPSVEEETLNIKAPIQLIEEYSNLNKELTKVVEAMKEKGKKSINMKNKSFSELVWYYVSSVINRVNKMRFSSSEKLSKSLRYEPYIIYPYVVVLTEVEDKENAIEIVDSHPKQFYQIMAHMKDVEYNVINDDITEDLLRPNISERSDIAYLSTIGSTILLLSKKSQEILAEKAKENGTSVEYETLLEIIPGFSTLELLQIQRFLLRFLDFFLTRKNIADMGSGEIMVLKEFMGQALDEFYTIKIVGHRMTHLRLEHGKETMLINNMFQSIMDKLELLDSAIESYEQIRSNFFQIALTVMLGVVSSVLILSPFEKDLYNSILSLVITGIITGTAYFGSDIYWRKMHQRARKMES
ncbi:MAG: hypothetical protein Q6356_000685 [Candidatus Wukongarchaeota archaeon]|nr:hypothetical protein [Candidatus Wukongarchaeota archaeon]